MIPNRYQQTISNFKKRIIQLEKLRVQYDEQALKYTNKRRDCRHEISDIKSKVLNLQRKIKEESRFINIPPRPNFSILDEKIPKNQRTLSEAIYGEGYRIICSDCRDIFEIQAILFLEQFNPTLADAVSLYFGFDRGIPRTFKTTAKLLLKLKDGRGLGGPSWGVTPEVAIQRVNQACRFLRHPKREKHLRKWVNYGT